MKSVIPSSRGRHNPHSAALADPPPVIRHLPAANLIVGKADLVLAVWLRAQLKDLPMTRGESIAVPPGGDPALSTPASHIDLDQVPGVTAASFSRN